MTISLKKNETRAFVILITIAAIAGIGWLIWSGTSTFELNQQKESFSEFQKANATTYQQGETIVGDSREDESSSSEAGWLYTAGFDWEGTMNWTVIDSWLYDTTDAAGISESSPGHFSPMPKEILESDDFDFLVCEVRVENIDAQLQSEDSHFNIATLRTGWVGYFDGTYLGASEKDGWAYNLDPGTTAIYHIGYYIPNPDKNQEFLIVSLGNASTEVDKISIQLNPHDMRGEHL